jgi:hypothetical protein
MKNKTNLLKLIVFSAILLMFSCVKDNKSVDTICNVNNPLTELDWLKSKIQAIGELNADVSKYIMIQSATYSGETVFIQTNCNPAGNSIYPVYNCTGVLLGNMAELGFDNFTNQSILWKTSNSACSSN